MLESIPMLGVIAIAIIGTLFLSWIIAKGCDIFEPAAEYLGRNLQEGVKGSTINSIGSSMPELCTAFAFLFLVSSSQGQELFSASIAVTAGSAVFNSMIIPSLVILAVTVPLISKMIFTKAMADKAGPFEINKGGLYRDFGFLFIAEIFFFYAISDFVIGIEDVIILLGIYFSYCIYMYIENKGEYEDYDPGNASETRMAWLKLFIAIVILTVACFALGEFVVAISERVGLLPAMIALLIAAPASSVPDTILAIKEAKNGEYVEAITTCLGSNIFDICVALGLPAIIYILLNGNIIIPQDDGFMMGLRIALIAASVYVAAVIFMPKRITQFTGWSLMAGYVVWMYTVLS